jgi:hypothetical protein
MPRYRTEAQPQTVVEYAQMKAMTEQFLAEVKLELVKSIGKKLHETDTPQAPGYQENTIRRTGQS